jgi:dynein heavy chain
MTLLCQAALELHGKVVASFRKTAINFHYEFNIRHLANVFQGLLMSMPDIIKTPALMGALWAHESERVYGDRLVNSKDLTLYLKNAKEIGRKYFKEIQPGLLFPEPLIFCHFAKSVDDSDYDRVETFDGLRTILESGLRAYNEVNANMNLVLFEDAMRHVCRIGRIMQNGHALLVGVGGSGKQSLSRLAAYICQFTTVQVDLYYSCSPFRLASPSNRNHAFAFGRLPYRVHMVSTISRRISRECTTRPGLKARRSISYSPTRRLRTRSSSFT